MPAMSKKKAKGAKAKYREERRQLAELLVERFNISPEREPTP
jgi:hypothetical protein